MKCLAVAGDVEKKDLETDKGYLGGRFLYMFLTSFSASSVLHLTDFSDAQTVACHV